MLSTPRLSPDPTVTHLNAAIKNEKMIHTQHSDDARHPVDYMSPCASEESETFTAKRTSTIEGPMELYLDANDRGVYKKSLLHVESGDINRVKDIFERVTSLRHPMRTIPLPTHSEPYGTTHQLFSQIKTTFLEQTSVFERSECGSYILGTIDMVHGHPARGTLPCDHWIIPGGGYSAAYSQNLLPASLAHAGY